MALNEFWVEKNANARIQPRDTKWLERCAKNPQIFVHVQIRIQKTIRFWKEKRQRPDSTERHEVARALCQKSADFCACSNPDTKNNTILERKTPTPGFEPGNPCGNKISSLAEYQIVPRWQEVLF